MGKASRARLRLRKERQEERAKIERERKPRAPKILSAADRSRITKPPSTSAAKKMIARRPVQFRKKVG